MNRAIAIALLIFSCSYSHATEALVQHAISDTCSVTITASGLNILAVMCEGQTSYATAVADDASGGSNSYTEVIGSRGGFATNVGLTSIWYTQATHSGATTLTCTSSSSCYGTAAWEISGGLMAGNPVDASSGTINIGCISTSCTGAAITTANAGSFIVTGAAPGVGLTGVGAPYTDFLGGTANGQAMCDYLPGTTVSNSAAVWTDSSPGDAVGSSAVAFLPAASAAAPVSGITVTPGSGSIKIAPGSGFIKTH